MASNVLTHAAQSISSAVDRVGPGGWFAGAVLGVSAMVVLRTHNRAVLIDPERRWHKLCLHLDVSDERATDWWMDIARHYSEPQRRYHTLQHVRELLQLRDKYASVIGDERDDDDAGAIVELAIFFHDVIYDPTAAPGKNEQDSADLFREFARKALFRPDVASKGLQDTVYDMIVATAKHAPPATAPEMLRLFLDMDMAVLSWPWPRYVKYAHAIRFEYKHIPFFDYCNARAKVLESFLGPAAQPSAAVTPGTIYTSQALRHLEYQAVRNLRAEIAALRRFQLPTADAAGGVAAVAIEKGKGTGWDASLAVAACACGALFAMSVAAALYSKR